MFKPKLQNKKNPGFTLIELLVVATIIIVLSALGLVSYRNAGQNARNAKRQSDIETVRQALVLYKSDTGAYPVSSSFTNMLTTIAAYVSDPVPVDPKDGVTSCGTGGTLVCRYQYSGTANTFTLTAPREGTTSYTATNP